MLEAMAADGDDPLTRSIAFLTLWPDRLFSSAWGPQPTTAGVEHHRPHHVHRLADPVFGQQTGPVLHQP